MSLSYRLHNYNGVFKGHACETLCSKSLTLSLINNEDEIYTFWIT